MATAPKTAAQNGNPVANMNMPNSEDPDQGASVQEPHIDDVEKQRCAQWIHSITTRLGGASSIYSALMQIRCRISRRNSRWWKLRPSLLRALFARLGIDLDDFMERTANEGYKRAFLALLVQASPYLGVMFYVTHWGAPEFLQYLWGFCLLSRLGSTGHRQPLTSLSMPWTIPPALVVLWGVCWKFYYPAGTEETPSWPLQPNTGSRQERGESRAGTCK